MTTSIKLEFEDGRTSLTALSDIQIELKRAGVGVWPLPLDGVPDAVRRLLEQAILTEAETASLVEHFLLSRERLLEIIAAAGRTPNVPGGGELETTVVNEGYSYPQLWVVQSEEDYSRFDRFHINVADDGTGVDEALQMVAGKGVVIRVRTANSSIQNLRLDCPNDGAGWLVSYNGGKPHCGSLGGASRGTKLMVQVIGPKKWELTYTDD